MGEIVFPGGYSIPYCLFPIATPCWLCPVTVRFGTVCTVFTDRAVCTNRTGCTVCKVCTVCTNRTVCIICIVCTVCTICT